jgi:serine/threonine-protein kinase
VRPWRGRLPSVPGVELLETAGGGTLCVVFRARDPASGEPRAVKVLRRTWETRPEAREFLHQEAHVSHSVCHPSVIAVHKAHLQRPPYFLTLEWLDGETVDALLARARRLPIPKALWIAREAASALAALEQAGYHPATCSLRLPDGSS